MVTDSRGRRESTTPTSSSWPEWGRTPRSRSSTARRWAFRPAPWSVRDGLHLAQSRETLERLGLDLTHALASQPEAAADVLQRLGIGVVQAVAEDQDLPLAVSQSRQGLGEGLAAQRDLDLLVGERPFAGA